MPTLNRKYNTSSKPIASMAKTRVFVKSFFINDIEVRDGRWEVGEGNGRLDFSVSFFSLRTSMSNFSFSGKARSRFAGLTLKSFVFSAVNCRRKSAMIFSCRVFLFLAIKADNIIVDRKKANSVKLDSVITQSGDLVWVLADSYYLAGRHHHFNLFSFPLLSSVNKRDGKRDFRRGFGKNS